MATPAIDRMKPAMKLEEKADLFFSRIHSSRAVKKGARAMMTPQFAALV